jgi:AmmeMemoRadiSam system protein A
MDYLSRNEKKQLLELARTAIAARLYRHRPPQPARDSLSSRLSEKGAAFVTLHKHGQLRGCIGNIIAEEPLVDNVMHNAVNAAFNDPRFPALTDLDELDEVEIEISVLTPPRRIESADQFVVGRHGIILSRGWSRAVFLPQVAPEQGWDMKTTLEHLSLKAGLPADAWRDEDTKFEVFEAIVFGENEDRPNPLPPI